MSRFLRDFRLMPIVLIAIGCLFALKTIGLLSDGGYTLGQRLGGSSNALVVTTTVPGAPVTQMRSPAVPLEVASAQAPKSSWMQEMFNYPGGGDITGAITTSERRSAALSVCNAAASPFQNLRRERRMYQFDRSSTKLSNDATTSGVQ